MIVTLAYCVHMLKNTDAAKGTEMTKQVLYRHNDVRVLTLDDPEVNAAEVCDLDDDSPVWGVRYFDVVKGDMVMSSLAAPLFDHPDLMRMAVIAALEQADEYEAWGPE